MTEIAQHVPALVENLELLWNQCAAADAAPDFILCSPKGFKVLRRYWRSKRKGKYKWVELTATQVVELGIPRGSVEAINEWWNTDHYRVDKRCVKRFKRRAKRRA